LPWKANFLHNIGLRLLVRAGPAGCPWHPWYFPETTEKEAISVLMIRLARMGARKQPYYRVVVIDKNNARNGRAVEVVGTYNPRTNPASVDLKRERIEHWVKNGAQLSDRVEKLMSKANA
jgi:small subunit ribosomal protein S16